MSRRENRGRPYGVVATAVAVLVSLGPTARADHPRDPYVVVADPKMSVEPTVRTFDSVGRLVFRYEDALPFDGVDTSRWTSRLLLGLGRVAKLLLVDEPLAELETVVVHEAGGHGARGRELGFEPTFQFYLPGIYRLVLSPDDKEKIGAFTAFGTSTLIEEPRDIVGTLGGLEANYLHAWWINARIARSAGWVHHGDLLVYGASKLPYSDSFFSPAVQKQDGSLSSSNDVASYVTGLQERSNGWRPEDRRRIARRLGVAYLWNLADPTLLYAFWGTVRSLYKGERFTQMPLPTIGRDTTLLISPRFNLTPFGAEHILDVFLASQRRGRMLDFYARVGSSGIESYYGAGVKLFGVHDAVDRLTFGGELDLWRQPEIILHARGLYDAPQRLGLNAGVYLETRVTSVLAITGKLAAKTPGYLMGQPLDGGLYGYAGASLSF